MLFRFAFYFWLPCTNTSHSVLLKAQITLAAFREGLGSWHHPWATNLCTSHYQHIGKRTPHILLGWKGIVRHSYRGRSASQVLRGIMCLPDSFSCQVSDSLHHSVMQNSHLSSDHNHPSAGTVPPHYLSPDSQIAAVHLC